MIIKLFLIPKRVRNYNSDLAVNLLIGKNGDKAEEIKNYIEEKTFFSNSSHGSSSASLADELQKLSVLHKEGGLSDDEFNSAKKSLIG